MSDYTRTGPGKNHEGNVIDFLIARGLTGVEKVKKDGGPDGKAVEGNFEFKQNRSAKMFSIKIQWDGTNIYYAPYRKNPDKPENKLKHEIISELTPILEPYFIDNCEIRYLNGTLTCEDKQYRVVLPKDQPEDPDKELRKEIISKLQAIGLGLITSFEKFNELLQLKNVHALNIDNKFYETGKKPHNLSGYISFEKKSPAGWLIPRVRSVANNTKKSDRYIGKPDHGNNAHSLTLNFFLPSSTEEKLIEEYMKRKEEED